MLKKVPESTVWVVVNAPELSVAVGSFHEMEVPVLWYGTVTATLSGQRTTTGGSVSPESYKKQ